MKCPGCKKKVAFKSAEMPFCSERCRILDLADWATEKHVISTAAGLNEFDGELESMDSSSLEPGSGLLQ
jgi:endogenous inhibitor of DNA gyrase (YacG/DUF329 family)